jgi:hypothetical protein
MFRKKPSSLSLDPRTRNPRDFGHNPLRELLTKLRRGKQLAIPRPGLLRHIDYSLYNAGSMQALYGGGVPIAWFRVSMGISGVDQEGLDQAQAFYISGGIPFLYHLFLDFDGLTQANHFLTVANPVIQVLDGKGLVALDQETPLANNATRRPKSEAFCNRIRAASAMKTALYTNNNYANTWGLKGAWIKPAFDVTWQAQWSSGDPTQIDGWYSYADSEEKKRCFRQSGVHPTHWWEDAVTGITSPIDVDWYYGTLTDIKTLLGLSPTLEQRVTALEALAHTH